MASNFHTAWAQLLVRMLARSGAREFVISPGSRSTPITLAAAQDPEVRCHSVVDERAAGFFALGIGRATGKPAVLLCTSGTAATHYLPAMTEAHHAGVPIIALTADRPWEAYDCAAPQTIDQSDLYGSILRHRAELGLPEEEVMDAVVRVAAQSVARSVGAVPGPVHINARFRKPLEPVVGDEPEPWRARWTRWMEKGPTRVFAASQSVSAEGVAWLAEKVREAKRPLVVCGPSLGASPPGMVDALAEALGAPVLAEATSQQRWDTNAEVVRCGRFDLVLRAEGWARTHVSDCVIEVGMPAVSTAYTRYTAAHQPPRYVLAEHGWNDPFHTARAHLVGATEATLAALVKALKGHKVTKETRRWERDWQDAEGVCAEVLKADDDATLHEGKVVERLVTRLSNGSALMLGNSMPVRDIDTFVGSDRDGALRIHHQRGASGIDGLFAGTAGVRAVDEASPVVAALVGDVSAAHDVGGLNVCRTATLPLILVVIDNGGGRIFAELPLGRVAERDRAVGAAFETHFLTPQSVDLEGAAKAFGLRFVRAMTVSVLDKALTQAMKHQGATLIEAKVAPEDGTARRARLVKAVRARLEA